MRRVQIAWKHCPNCDEPLGKRIFVGDVWECQACGESGTREPGLYDTAPLSRWGAWDWDTTESLPELPTAQHGVEPTVENGGDLPAVANQSDDELPF